MMDSSIMFEKVITIENKMDSKFLEYDDNFDKIFNSMQEEEFKQKIFYEGQIYDAHSLLVDIIKSASKHISIIDNYIDKTVLDLLTNKKDNVDVTIVGRDKLNLSLLDVSKFNSQYSNLAVIHSEEYHDRFIIIDKTVYHCGASLKDLGKKAFAITKMEDKSLIDKLLLQNERANDEGLNK